MVIVVIKAHSKVNRMFLHLTLSLSNLYILQTTFSHGQMVEREREKGISIYIWNIILFIGSKQQYLKANAN